MPAPTTQSQPSIAAEQHEPARPAPAPAATAAVPKSAPQHVTGIWTARLESGEWQCVLSIDGEQFTKGPLPRRLFLREVHRALEQLNERVFRVTGAPRG